MQLVRAHGLGNDYLVLESGEPLDASLVRALCDRHRGPGADGVLEPVPVLPLGEPADHAVRIWNPDGSIAEKSGNGLRIFARWLADRGAPPRFSVWTGFDRVACEVGETITLAMGRARVGDPEVIDGWRLIPVDLGNPHAVVFVDGPLDAVQWREAGARLERHPRFPQRTNVQFVQVAEGALNLRIWERGAGETLASGSSSCAAAAAAVASDRLGAGPIVVRMPGGRLDVTVNEDGEVWLAGPVEVVGRIEVDPRWLAARRPDR
jgi:diaminopimelate epimerase